MIIKRRTFVAALAVAPLASTLSSTVAWAKRVLILPANQTGVPLSFLQHNSGVKNAPGVPLYDGYSITNKGGVNLGASGCAFFSTFSMYLKCRARPLTATIMDFRAENNKALTKGNAVTTSDGILSWQTAGCISGKAKISHVKAYDVDGPAYPVLKKIYDRGNVAIVGVYASKGKDSHWVFCDHVANGKSYIIDTARSLETLEEGYYSGKAGTIHEFSSATPVNDRLELTKIKKPGAQTTPRTVDVNRGYAGNDTTPVGTYRRLNEEDLVGMESYKKTKELYEKSLQPKNIEDASKLSVEEDIALGALDERRRASQVTIYDHLNRAVSISGIVMILYSILLFVLYWVDRAAPAMGISTLKVATLGKMESVADKSDEGKYKGGRRVALKTITISTLTGIVVGTLVASGVVPTLVEFIVSLVRR